MLSVSDLNIFAIIVAWLVNIGFGAFWYSPAGFGKLWSKLSGVDMMKMPKDAANKAIGSVAVAALVQTVVLAMVVQALELDSVGQAVTTGLVLWAGLVAATTVGNNLYLRFSWKFWWLNASFFLIVMVVNTVLLTVWQ